MIVDETPLEEAVAARVETAEIDEVPPGDRAEEIRPVAAPLRVVVSVQGAIRRAGVYTLDNGARVSDLIKKAGGLTDLAVSSDINMAARLIDATTLAIPSKAEQRRFRGGRVSGRGAPPEVRNPHQYTISGWRPEALAGSASPQSAKDPSGADNRIDINRASQDALEELPGIGPVLAAAIVAHRENSPFRSVDQLQEVSGIGPKRYEAVRALIVAR